MITASSLAKQALRLDAADHRLERLGVHRRAAGRSVTRMAAEQHGRNQDRLDPQPRQRQRLRAAADAARGDIAGEDQDAGHGGPDVAHQKGRTANASPARGGKRRAARSALRRWGPLGGEQPPSATRCFATTRRFPSRRAKGLSR